MLPAQTAYLRRFVADQPLAGRRIVVTRPEAKSLVEELEGLGAEVTLVPLIEIRDTEDRGALADAIAGFSSYDWIVFTSVNGVAAVSEGLMGLAGPRVAAVGPITADAIRERGVEPSFVASRASDDIAAGLGELAGSACSCRRRTSQNLRSRRNCATRGGRRRRRRLSHGSRRAADVGNTPAPDRRCGRSRERLGVSQPRGCRRRRRGRMLVCIGPKTAKVAREVGLKVGLVADETTSDGIIRALVSHFGEKHMTSLHPLDALRTARGAKRPRRLRRTAALRDLVRETTLEPSDFV